jgi:putative transposase
MPTAWTQLYIHLIFSTKLREPLITPQLETDLHPFLGGIVRDLRCSLIQIGGVSDHVHLLIRIRPDITVSDLVRHVKGRSSTWFNDHAGHRVLQWQEGYGCFSVSRSLLDDVTDYIRRQKEHHANLTFQEEFEMFLRKHGIDFRPEDVWQTDA